jgi:Putative zinc-finger
MMGWWKVVMGGAGPFAAFPSRATTYLPLALLAVLLVFSLIKAVGLWQEIHEVEEPVTSGDLLATFEQAHADGELDDDEFERVREHLASCPSGDQSAATGSRPPNDAAARKRTGPSTADLDEQSHSPTE